MRKINEATGHHCDMRHIGARLLMVLFAITAVVAGAPTSASGAGDPEVDGLIVQGALPGWAPVPTAALEQAVTTERTAMRAATDHTFQLAVEGWRQGSQSLVVVLVSFPDGDVPNDFRARDAVIGACGAATRSAPRSMTSYALIADSTEAMCQGTSAAGVRVDAAVMAWRQGHIFVLTIGNRFATSELEDFALAQHAALPAPVAGQSSGSSSSSNT
ncbi:MAG: hypothetical protein QOI44_2382, partial [Actinomycetota bacterium]|nr:hypothetical protein [Actinomycetota bacterium]